MTASGRVRVRIAPSPTGQMHVGTARTALFNWLFARKHGGSLVLRIDDTDRERCLKEHVPSIVEGLKWLGLDWDEGPYFQSQRLELYRMEAQRLLSTGMAYWCFCTPQELEERKEAARLRGQAWRYDGNCRGLSVAQQQRLKDEGRLAVLRFRMPTEGETVVRDLIRGEIRFQNEELDDFVLMKSDGWATYQLASVVDDYDLGITHVIRGDDFISSTPRQMHLFEGLGYPLPEFAHLPMILGLDRKKLSKRHGATALIEYSNQGILPEAMFNFLALLGWAPGLGEDKEIFGRQELIERFRLEDVNPSGAIFDQRKLVWMNGYYIRHTPLDTLTNLCLTYLQNAGLVGTELSNEERNYVSKIMGLVRERMRSLSEAPQLTSFFFGETVEYEEKAVSKWLKQEGVDETLGKLLSWLGQLQDFSQPSIEATVRSLASELGVPAAKVIHPTRVVLTGRTEGPGLFELMEVLGKERCIRRLQQGINFLRQAQPAQPAKAKGGEG